MNSCRRDLRNGVLLNPKLFILEKFNFGQPIKCWSNLVKLSQTWSNVFKLVLFGTGRYTLWGEMHEELKNETTIPTSEVDEYIIHLNNKLRGTIINKKN